MSVLGGLRLRPKNLERFGKELRGNVFCMAASSVAGRQSNN
jgi:hypothetical protein